MRIHQYNLKAGIRRTRAFEEKRLASYAVNVGVKCGHGCKYCSTGAVLRRHPSFRRFGEDPFGFDYAIIDPKTPETVAMDARRIGYRGMVQLCTTTDAWAPEAHEHNLGRRCLESILSEPGWEVRILTKNVAVTNDFEFIKKYRDRVLVGLSITGTPDKSEVLEIVEPHASSVRYRMAAMVEAVSQGLRTYGMLCPLLPGIADSPEQIDDLIKFAIECNAEEIFAEPVNPRGPGLRLCQEALELWGYTNEAKAVQGIRNRVGWSRYVVDLVHNVQTSVRRCSDISLLRFLLYPNRL